jgi:hypothetical protein
MIKNLKLRLFSSQNVFRIDLLSKIKRNFLCYLFNGKGYISKLENRSLLVMQGPETYEILQELTNNDIELLLSKPKQSQEN